MLFSQASAEKSRLQQQLKTWRDSTSQQTGDSARRDDVGRLDRTLHLRSAQSDNLLRAFEAAQALASHPDAGYLESCVRPSDSTTRVKADTK